MVSSPPTATAALAGRCAASGLAVADSADRLPPPALSVTARSAWSVDSTASVVSPSAIPLAAGEIAAPAS